MLSTQIQDELQTLTRPDKAIFLPYFFKTGKGEYAEGDKFIGVVVPDQRSVARKHFKQASLDDVQKLLDSPIHEHRLTGLIILTYKFEKGDNAERKLIYDFYLKNTRAINNWDLVDCSAHKIVGQHLIDKDRSILYKLAHSKNLWEQRIAIVSTFAFIRLKDFEDCLNLAEIFLTHEHDLIHKAVGWMLREVGKKDEFVLVSFLNPNYKKMPRTMLRYAIEKFPEQRRILYLKGLI
ncbi:MAG: DNA alkylation repair protein [bacterium]